MSSSLNAAVFLYIQKKVQEMVNKKAAKHITNEIEMVRKINDRSLIRI
mgnify:FL=1|jgi:hypothetical protein